MSKARDLANAGTALTTVSPTELGYLDGVTSAVQTQIDSKIGSASAINPTIFDAKGDLLAATAADTLARVAIGTNGQVLSADSTASTGVAWITPASGGSMTLLSTTTLSGTSVTISSISQSYNHLYIYIADWYTASGGGGAFLQVNGNTTSPNYFHAGVAREGGNNAALNSDASGGIYPVYTNPAYSDNNNVLVYEIENYTSSLRKVGRLANFYQGTSASVLYTAGMGINVQAAITSIRLFSNDTQYGTAYIYGVK